jgi:hypothetical protein
MNPMDVACKVRLPVSKPNRGLLGIDSFGSASLTIINRMHRSPIVLLLALASGCAQFAGGVNLGGERYIATASATAAQGGLTAAEKTAYSDAGARCIALGKTMSVVDERKSPPLWSDGAARVDLTFACH